MKTENFLAILFGMWLAFMASLIGVALRDHINDQKFMYDHGCNEWHYEETEFQRFNEFR